MNWQIAKMHYNTNFNAVITWIRLEIMFFFAKNTSSIHLVIDHIVFFYFQVTNELCLYDGPSPPRDLDESAINERRRKHNYKDDKQELDQVKYDI